MAISGGPLSGGPIGAEAQQSADVGRRPYPYLIQAGVKLKIARVEVEIIGAITGGGAKRFCPEGCRKSFWRSAPAERLTTLPLYAA
jgi:hypothetical protein